MYSLPLLSRSGGMDGDRSFSSASNNSASNEDHEYVWDGFTQGDQLAATPNDDYYEDLELAARLGKKLLQKNKELDILNYQLRCSNEEQTLEIEHLNKQLTWLRDVNESKSRMFEQLDTNYQELEAANRKLKIESREWKERVTKCMSVCETQDDQIQSLKAEIESFRKMRDGKRARERMRRRTIHGCLPSDGQEELDIQKFLETSAEFSESLRQKEEKRKSSSDEEVTALHEIIGNLKAQQIMDKRMIKELRKDMDAVLQENQDVCEKLQEERDMTQRLNRIIEEYDKVIYRQAFVAESTPNITAELTNNEIDFSEHTDDENEDEAANHPQVVGTTPRLDGKSFQSPNIKVHTPLSQYLRIANSTPMKSLNLSPASQSQPHDVSPNPGPKVVPLIPQNSNHLSVKSEPKNVSLVQELDTQYKTLLGKYEMLLQSIESERVGSPVTDGPGKGCGDATSSSFLNESSFVSDASTNTSRPSSAEGMPEYKRLFRELFSVINEAKT